MNIVYLSPAPLAGAGEFVMATAAPLGAAVANASVRLHILLAQGSRNPQADRR